MTYSRRRPPSGSVLTKTRSATTVPGTHDPLEIKVDCYHDLHACATAKAPCGPTWTYRPLVAVARIFPGRGACSCGAY